MNAAAVRKTATFVIYCFAVFIATVLAMPFLKDGYYPIDDKISQGAIGENGYIQVLGFFSLAAGSFAVALLLRTASASTAVRITSALMAFSAACVVALAVFPTDRPGEDTVVGSTHAYAAALAFLANIAAMLWSGFAFRRERSLAPLAIPSLVLGIAAFALLVMISAGPERVGLVQRATVACEMVWLLMVAWRLRAIGGDEVQPELQHRAARAPR